MSKDVHRPVGRPPIAGERMEQISVRLTPDELAAVDRIAKQRDISRNEAFRMVLNDGLEGFR